MLTGFCLKTLKDRMSYVIPKHICAFHSDSIFCESSVEAAVPVLGDGSMQRYQLSWQLGSH